MLRKNFLGSGYPRTVDLVTFVPESSTETVRLDFLQGRGDPPYYSQRHGCCKQVPETGERDFSFCPCAETRAGELGH